MSSNFLNTDLITRKLPSIIDSHKNFNKTPLKNKKNINIVRNNRLKIIDDTKLLQQKNFVDLINIKHESDKSFLLSEILKHQIKQDLLKKYNIKTFVASENYFNNKIDLNNQPLYHISMKKKFLIIPLHISSSIKKNHLIKKS